VIVQGDISNKSSEKYRCSTRNHGTVLSSSYRLL
jgi:hypothetical protein